MKKIILRTILSLALIAITALPAWSQATKFAQAGMGFLKIDIDARNAAMGGTYIGSLGTANHTFGNPAAMAEVEGFDVSASLIDWIADIQLYGIGAAYTLGNIGTFGFNLVVMDYGDIRRTRPWQAGDDPALRDQGYIDGGMFTVNEFAVGISYARKISTQFAIGGNLRFAQQDLGNADIINAFTGEIQNVGNSLDNIIFDFGTVYYPGFRDLRFGVSFRNFSNQSDYFDQRFELPLTLDFGVAMDLLQLPQDVDADAMNSSLTFALDWVHPRDFDERLHVGVEYGLSDIVFLRSGYKFNYDEEGFTAGLGVQYVADGGYGIRADYAYSAFGDFFDDVNRFTVSILFQ